MRTNQLLTSAFLIAALVGCSASSDSVKSAIEKDPSIVFTAIEKDPKGFFDTVKKAQENYARQAQQSAMDEENKQREEEFKNPLQPAVEQGRVIFGPANAKVTIVEYSDFECPYCSKGFMVMKEVLKNYPNDVRVVYKHLPLDFHPKALPAAKYFEAIAAQDHKKAEKFHDAVFQNQDKLKRDGEDYLKSVAKSLGVNQQKLTKDLASDSVMARINADVEEARKYNINGTPGFIINGVSLHGARDFEDFKAIIDRHLQK